MAALFAAIALFACTQDATEGINSQTVEANIMNELPQQRTYEEALAIAQEAADLFDKNGSATRINQSRTISPSNVQLITSNSSTRNASSSDTLMYVFNYDNNAGFAVVSTNRATEGLIAGAANPVDLPEIVRLQQVICVKYHKAVKLLQAKIAFDFAQQIVQSVAFADFSGAGAQVYGSAVVPGNLGGIVGAVICHYKNVQHILGIILLGNTVQKQGQNGLLIPGGNENAVATGLGIR